MMQFVIQRLLASPSVTAIVGNRVFAQMADQTAPIPYLTLATVSEVTERCREGIYAEEIRFQVDAIGKSYGQKQDLYYAVREALDGLKENDLYCEFINAVDLTRENGSAYGKAIDFQLIKG